jgi:hypothetical protein
MLLLREVVGVTTGKLCAAPLAVAAHSTGAAQPSTNGHCADQPQSWFDERQQRPREAMAIRWQ